jgi:putative photosynthetic complex assembly protein
MVAKAEEHPFPKVIVVGGAIMIVLAILAAALSNFTNVGVSRTAIPSSIVERRDILVTDRADGAVIISDASDTTANPDVLMPGSNGFVRVAVSGLAFTRQTHGIGKEPPFQLLRAADDRLWLYDPSTGGRVDLNAFGPQNRQVFAKLLPSGRTGQNGKTAP